ncbi:hypothetical protein P691DRAFT_808000 [Macrolepiota fuliginosa MF-IS2]|uniref:N-acetyltransferase domain-containing protein n=1 Tax=Macrolepiota fuliginosa MF-IS2 TaxID=1400762 RepID=A0A9P5X621_9AGAR|nr:hypothetical protein P691DRAFT_808000 [Macrolepiota fuliginosa MF-IS2]
MASSDLRVRLTRGLEGRDQHIDFLSQLFEESQMVSVEIANPALDLISFAQDCRGFWVVTVADTAPEHDDWFPEEHTNSLGLVSGPSSSNSSAKPSLRSIDGTLNGTAPTRSGSVDRFHWSTSSNTSTTIQLDNVSQAEPYTGTGYASDEIYQPNQKEDVAGFVYFLPSSAYPDALHFEEYNIGIVLHSYWRGRGVATKALYVALESIFSHPDVHRVQAQLIDCYNNDKALTLFTRIGFSHEGTRRQGFRCPLTAEWRDVTTLALLVTDWFLHVRDRRNNLRSGPKSLWDALFGRHQQEQEELLRWDNRRPRRTSSLETIRESAPTPVPAFPGETDISDAEAATASESEKVERPKRKLFEIGGSRATDSGDAYDASSSEYDSEYESAAEGSPPKRVRSRRGESSSAESSSAPDSSAPAINMLGLHFVPLSDVVGIEAPAAGSGVDGPGATGQISPARGDTASVVHRDGLHGQTWSPSVSPEPREGSVLSVPSSESDSEFEDDDMTSSSSSASPSSWELIDGDEEFRPGS